MQLMLMSISSSERAFVRLQSRNFKLFLNTVLLVLLMFGLVQKPGFAETRVKQDLLSYSGSPISRLYAEGQWGVHAVRHSDLDFFPLLGSGTLGLWLFNNIGVEVFGDIGLGSFEDGPFSLEVEEAGGIAMRFQSPPRNGFSLYFTAGYVDFQVTQTVTDERGIGRVSEGFAGLRLGVGLAQRLPVFENVLVIGEYRNYFSEDELQVDTLTLGLRVNIR